MYRIIGVMLYKKDNQQRMKLKFKLPNNKDKSVDKVHTGNITHGTIISTMVTEFGINPNDVVIPPHIANELPIKG